MMTKARGSTLVDDGPVEGLDEHVHVDHGADQPIETSNQGFQVDLQGSYPVHHQGRAPLKILLFKMHVLSQ